MVENEIEDLEDICLSAELAGDGSIFLELLREGYGEVPYLDELVFHFVYDHYAQAGQAVR